MKHTFNLAILLVASCLISTLGYAGHHSIRVGGTGSSVQMMMIMGQAYQETYPGQHVQVVSGLGSNGGMRALAAKKIHISISALALNKEALAVGAISEEYARTPYMLTTAPGVNLKEITTAEVASILSGETERWPNDEVMRLVMRPLGDSDTLFLRSIAPAVDEAVNIALKRDGIIMAPTDQDSADALEQTPGAFGVTTLAQMKTEKRKLKPVMLNGISPSVAELVSGRYKYFKSLSTVINKDASEEILHFVDYIRSEAGSALLAEYGHMVIAK